MIPFVSQCVYAAAMWCQRHNKLAWAQALMRKSYALDRLVRIRSLPERRMFCWTKTVALAVVPVRRR